MFDLTRRLFVTGSVLALLAPLCVAEDKKDAKPTTSGTWKQKDGQTVIEFVDKETLKLMPHGDTENIVIECSFTVEKGVVKAMVTGHEGKDEIKKKLAAAVPLKSEFTFKWAVDGDTASIDGFEGKDLEGVKSRVEGKYEKK